MASDGGHGECSARASLLMSPARLAIDSSMLGSGDRRTELAIAGIAKYQRKGLPPCFFSLVSGLCTAFSKDSIGMAEMVKKQSGYQHQ